MPLDPNNPIPGLQQIRSPLEAAVAQQADPAQAIESVSPLLQPVMDWLQSLTANDPMATEIVALVRAVLSHSMAMTQQVQALKATQVASTQAQAAAQTSPFQQPQQPQQGARLQFSLPQQQQPQQQGNPGPSQQPQHQPQQQGPGGPYR